MNNGDVLDTFEEFSYVYYDNVDDKLLEKYNNGIKLLEKSGFSLGLSNQKMTFDTAIILENNYKVIGGTFFNIHDNKKSIVIRLTYVDEQYRGKGIYKKFHNILDNLSNKLGKEKIYAYVHSQNTFMSDTIMKKIGYFEVMKVMCRSVEKENE